MSVIKKDSEILSQDFENLVNSNLNIDKLKNSTVLITGATGLIGSLLVKLLNRYNIVKQTNIKIIACVRNEEKAKIVFEQIINDENLIIKLNDINNPIEMDIDIDYIIHAASATSSKYFVTNPVETILTAINGTNNILKFAKEKEVKGFIYLSSLEVYGTPNTTEFLDENQYGYIDPLSTRSSYSEGKRMVECLCVSYANEYNLPVTIARLSQTFGAGVDYNDGRVFAEFARCAIEKRDIVLKTEGKTVRSYCYSTDALSAILIILQNGESGNAYNVTNMDTVISIKDMAQLVCDTFKSSNIKVKIDIPSDIASFGFNPEMIIKLDSTKLLNLGWTPIVTLQEMFIRLVNSMKENKD